MSSITTTSVSWPSVAAYAKARQTAQANANAYASGVAKLDMSGLIHELAVARTTSQTAANTASAVACPAAQTITRHALPAEAAE